MKHILLITALFMCTNSYALDISETCLYLMNNAELTAKLANTGVPLSKVIDIINEIDMDLNTKEVVTKSTVTAYEAALNGIDPNRIGLIYYKECMKQVEK